MTLSKDDHTRFSDAIEAGDIEAVALVLQEYPEIADHPDWTPPPLHCAVLWDQPKVAEMLLDHGSDIEQRDPDRDTTPLRYAVMYCRTKLIPLLLARGARTGAITPGGMTALEMAIAGTQGAYEEYPDLPRRETYSSVVELLRQHNVR